MKPTVLLSIFLVTLLCAAPAGSSFPRVVIGGDAGGVVAGGTWDSAVLAGKTVMLFYVDPDEKGKGEAVMPVMEAAEKAFAPEAFGVHFIVNLAATWKPGMLIETLLKEKAAEHPLRTYVLDRKRTLVEKWGAADDEYNCMILGPGGEVLLRHAGAWSGEEIARARSVLEHALGPLQ